MDESWFKTLNVSIRRDWSDSNALLTTFPATPTHAAEGPKPSPVPDAFTVRRMNLLPNLPPPRMQAVTFPREFPAATVEEIAILARLLHRQHRGLAHALDGAKRVAHGLVFHSEVGA